jgi:hypothetical protein
MSSDWVSEDEYDMSFQDEGAYWIAFYANTKRLEVLKERCSSLNLDFELTSEGLFKITTKKFSNAFIFDSLEQVNPFLLGVTVNHKTET